MDNLKFRVSAKLKNILGKDLITSPNIAVFELVKNSYDAHASKVEITFDQGTLVIADNGKGMSREDLINKWLFVAYSAKSDGSEDRKYSGGNVRHYAGAKGIGRMSCDSLARFLDLITKSADSNFTEILHIDWNTFEENNQSEFGTISVPHETSTTVPDFPLKSQTGTILKFSGLHFDWDVEKILQLRKSLEKMINPFSEDNSFAIEIIVPSESENDKLKLERIKELETTIDNSFLDATPKIAAIRNSIVNGQIENSISDVLKLKTTQIESSLKDGKICTKLLDRGELMYSIEEPSSYNLLNDISVSLFYLNRAAKYNFSMKMGTNPAQYGNVFLFRNGIRIWPYGEPDDDSWNLNKRVQQGYHRFLGTRELFGRVDISTDNVDDFKEVSSRDGGLIMTPSALQLIDYFTQVHRRLERYVSGVLWGETFLKKEYFKTKDDALRLRKSLQKAEIDSDTVSHIHENIGSRIDFLQIVKSLVNDPEIEVLYYNQRLANIVENTSDIDVFQTGVIDDLRKVAQKTNDEKLNSTIAEIEEHLALITRQKDDAERKAREAEQRADSERVAREKAEKERDAQIQKNHYLSSTRDTSKEVEDLMHTVLISSTELSSLIKLQKVLLQDDNFDKGELISITNDIEFNIERIHVLSSLITKADTSILRESMDLDVMTYTKEFLSYFNRSILTRFSYDSQSDFNKKIPILEYSIILQNLVSNSKKAGATELCVCLARNGQTLILDFSDNGSGVDLTRFTKDTIFEEGVTNRPGGRGIGLSTIRETLNRTMNGDIEFAGNGLNGLKGATFRITLL